MPQLRITQFEHWDGPRTPVPINAADENDAISAEIYEQQSAFMAKVVKTQISLFIGTPKMQADLDATRQSFDKEDAAADPEDEALDTNLPYSAADFRTLHSFGIVPFGFLKCVSTAEDITSPSPQEESRIPKYQLSRDKPLKPTVQLLQYMQDLRGSISQVSNLSLEPVNVEGEICVDARTPSLRAKRHLRNMAIQLKQTRKVRQVNTVRTIPEGVDYSVTMTSALV
jgi:hypothetical protein